MALTTITAEEKQALAVVMAAQAMEATATAERRMAAARP
jgi:hypothetical protein